MHITDRYFFETRHTVQSTSMRYMYLSMVGISITFFERDAVCPVVGNYGCSLTPFMWYWAVFSYCIV